MITEKQLPDLLKTVKTYAEMRKKRLSLMSKNLGKAPNYLSEKLKKNNAEILLLLQLSELLKVNLVEHYTALLSPTAQATHRERALYVEMEKQRKEIYELRKELEQVKAERDKYWEKVGK